MTKSEIAKDYRRIQDIKDQPGKEIGLASKMAKLITNAEKARGRYIAAKDLFGSSHSVTSIFLERANELCGTRVVSVGTLTTIGNTATAVITHIEEVIIAPVVNAIKRTQQDFPLSRRVKYGEDKGVVVSHETEDKESIYIIFDGESEAKNISIYNLKFA